ncbi:MAG: trypsin-like serine protease [Alphaproteobacteria bacterium]|nr:trypsin-like serine protease [Alphaproteobacteria bacterium SS10]
MSSFSDGQARVAVPTNDPFDQSYVVQPGTGFDAVVGVFTDASRGTGAVLSNNQYVLTAAHVVFGEAVGPMQIAVDLTSGRQFVDVVEVFIHPDYAPDSTGYSSANDIAILRLATPAPVAGYEIYRGSDEVGSTFTLTGYGVAGTGSNGTVTNDPGDGVTKRTGQNQYEAVDGETVFGLDDFLGDPTPDGSLLFYDFDNGFSSGDALGQEFGLFGIGLGSAEVNSTPGDSGGPSFINGQIAGVVSGGTDSFVDVSPSIDSSFGEISFDTRVSFYQSWIDGIVGTSTPVDPTPDPTPVNPGDDLLFADLYGGVIIAGDGNDTVFGDIGNDIVYGNQANDVIYGGGGADILYGGKDVDVLFGGDAGDVLYGNKEADQVYGNQGDDTFFGGQLSDTMFGGQGNDVLNGNKGDDFLIGNLGADLFVFGRNGSFDVIIDYNASEGDAITGSAFTSATPITATADGLILSNGAEGVLLLGLQVGDTVVVL